MRRTAWIAPAALAFALILAPLFAAAGGGWQAYDKSAFAAAQKAGKTIFVSVHADW